MINAVFNINKLECNTDTHTHTHTQHTHIHTEQKHQEEGKTNRILHTKTKNKE